MPSLLFAQKELRKNDRIRYAGIGYTKLGFGEVNRQLLNAKQVAKLNRHIEQIRAEYGAVVIFVSMIPEEVAEWETGQIGGLPGHYLGDDPRAARNHVMVLFGEEDGRNWVEYGQDNAPDFAAHTDELTRLFAKAYNKRKVYRHIRRVLKRVDRIYARLGTERQTALRHPVLTAEEWTDLAWAEVDITHEYDSAVHHLELAVRLDPAYARGYKLLGYAHLEQRQWDAAASAFATAWSLAADFEIAVGRLTLHYLQGESSEIDKWTEQVRQFTSEFDEEVYNVAHYSGRGFFLTENASAAFRNAFQHEITQSKKEETPEAKAY
ncbi:hypothetical protein [Parapedobacter sp. 10938]|uniref:hypothetical protein n=1 Tax=Parapedobacter flavus TaxID=3110225 RepID=UPI002DB73C06|nr:hypothetical protein [Parapedobacter sp. 10938]MEC3881159.1 hypothetical protein [Parapedobacter sp. 10938]